VHFSGLKIEADIMENTDAGEVTGYSGSFEWYRRWWQTTRPHFRVGPTAAEFLKFSIYATFGGPATA